MPVSLMWFAFKKVLFEFKVIIFSVLRHWYTTLFTTGIPLRADPPGSRVWEELYSTHRNSLKESFFHAVLQRIFRYVILRHWHLSRIMCSKKSYFDLGADEIRRYKIADISESKVQPQFTANMGQLQPLLKKY